MVAWQTAVLAVNAVARAATICRAATPPSGITDAPAPPVLCLSCLKELPR
jgi:hypothetical protein